MLKAYAAGLVSATYRNIESFSTAILWRWGSGDTRVGLRKLRPPR